MDAPADIGLPFFAYGLFRPGQLGFFQLRDLIDTPPVPDNVNAELLLRDGLPIIKPVEWGRVQGAILSFTPATATTAYERISAMEPDKHYRWDVMETNGGERANVLVGRSPDKGSVGCEEDLWDGWQDPLFTAALEVVEETLKAEGQFEWDLKPLFRLQMAYLLLWSSIERYVSLRYHLGNNVTKKIGHLAGERAFGEGLKRWVREGNSVYRADRPTEAVKLDPKKPKSSIEYYYQIRSNITHRGKGVPNDFDRLRSAATELLPIFRGVLTAAQEDAVYREA